ncbi:recombinase family protein [Paenarthrobacter sp. TA1.8]|uniref:recombinase family protein n=1 Tax=Paenarthrobacter sp. TA1.8 TaxID=3400219 RepID=UPI003B430B6D
MDTGYARVSTTKHDLARQMDALSAAGVEAQYTYVDKKSWATANRPGLQEAMRHARAGDVIVVHILDCLGRTVRDTLNLVQELKVGNRTPADPWLSTPPPQIAQCAAGVRDACPVRRDGTDIFCRKGCPCQGGGNGRRTGRPSIVDTAKLEHAVMLRDREQASAWEPLLVSSGEYHVTDHRPGSERNRLKT